eukprot:4534620-Amphidinium_carterae.2
MRLQLDQPLHRQRRWQAIVGKKMHAHEPLHAMLDPICCGLHDQAERRSKLTKLSLLASCLS